MSEYLITFDTDHIKRYVFGTNKLKEIRGASSLLDHLNRFQIAETARSAGLEISEIFAYGGSALFIVKTGDPELFGKAVQKLYHEKTGGGVSITYAIQKIPAYGSKDLLDVKEFLNGTTMADVIKLLHARMHMAKDTLQMYQPEGEVERGEKDLAKAAHVISPPSYVLLCTCNSCGLRYAEGIRADPDEPEGRYCWTCINKRDRDRLERDLLSGHVRLDALTNKTLWGRIVQTIKSASTKLSNAPFPTRLKRPKDFQDFRNFATAKDYLGLIYADANGMGKALTEQKTLKDVKNFAEEIDNAVFAAMGEALGTHLPVRDEQLRFDVLLVGGDDIVIVTPAEQALHVAHTLAASFEQHTDHKYTLSVGVVLVPITYPFQLQNALVEETIKAAKKSGSHIATQEKDASEQSHINFMVVSGNTSLSYESVQGELQRVVPDREEFYATMRPYSLEQFQWLLNQLHAGKEKRLGRTKLHQLREAILKLNRNTTILESLALLRNWNEQERSFIKDMVKHFDNRQNSQQEQLGTLFPWYLDSAHSSEEHFVYKTPLLDFIELYDFIPS